MTTKPEFNDLLIPRTCIILRYKAPYALWANQLDEPGKEPKYMNAVLADLNSDRTAYLIEQREDISSNLEKLLTQVEANFRFFFKRELEQCEEDPAKWPKSLTLELFKEWFDVEVLDTVVDIADPMKKAA